jgi:hypothetical protein
MKQDESRDDESRFCFDNFPKFRPSKFFAALLKLSLVRKMF